MQRASATRTAEPPRALAALSWLLALSAPLVAWLMWGVADTGFDRYHLPKELALSALALASAGTLSWSAGLVWDRLTQLVLASLVVAALATLLATTPALAWRAFATQLALSVLFLAARRCPEAARARVLGGVLIAASGVAAIALLEGEALLPGLSRAGRTPGATIGQRNTVAHLLVLASPLAWLGVGYGTRTLRVLAAFASALFAGAVVLTRSRAAWLGLALVALVFVLMQKKRAWLPLACALGGALVIALAPVRLAWSSARPYRDTLTQLVDVSQGSGAGRLAQYRTSLALVPLHPLFGVGPGNWMVEYPRVSPAHDPAFRARSFRHTGRIPNSDSIALLVEQGFFACVLALLLAGSVLASARGTARVLAASVISALLAQGALDAVLQLPASGCFAAIMLGVATRSDQPARGVGRWLARASLPLLLATTVCASLRLLALVERTRPGGGFVALERAVAFDPADVQARFALAEAFALKGDCKRAAPHLEALIALLPYHRAPRELGCLHDLPHE